MSLSNIECRIEISDVLSELDIGHAARKLDLSKFDNDIHEISDQAVNDLTDYIVECLEEPNNYSGITVEVDGEVHLSRFDISNIDDDELIEAIEEMGYTVLSSESEDLTRGVEPQNLFESLCKQFDLPRGATNKQRLIQHINSLL